MDHSQDKKLNNVESDVQDLKSARKAEQIRRMMEEEELIRKPQSGKTCRNRAGGTENTDHGFLPGG